MTTVSVTAAMEENSTKKTEEITGTVYESSQKEAYDFEEKISTDAAEYVGFSINGELTAEGEKNGVAAYAAVGETPVSFNYSYDSSLLNAKEDEGYTGQKEIDKHRLPESMCRLSADTNPA